VGIYKKWYKILQVCEDRPKVLFNYWECNGLQQQYSTQQPFVSVNELLLVESPSQWNIWWMDTMFEGIEIQKFNGEDYAYCSIRMKNLLMAKDI